MSARDVAFTLMALGHVAGCRGKTATEILAEAVGEIVRLQTERDRYRTELAGTGCHDIFCKEYGNKCDECVTQRTKETK